VSNGRCVCLSKSKKTSLIWFNFFFYSFNRGWKVWHPKKLFFVCKKFIRWPWWFHRLRSPHCFPTSIPRGRFATRVFRKSTVNGKWKWLTPIDRKIRRRTAQILKKPLKKWHYLYYRLIVFISNTFQVQEFFFRTLSWTILSPWGPWHSGSVSVAPDPNFPYFLPSFPPTLALFEQCHRIT